jgi:GT2 family glycosyltransferase
MNTEIARPERSTPQKQFSPRIGTVTVTYNSAAVLGPFLRCVFAQDLADFILYAIDNHSTDNSAAILEQHSDSRLKVLLNSTNEGVAEGNNRGIRAALEDGCETVLLLNNDTEFPADLFRSLYEGMMKYETSMATGKMLYFSPTNTIWCAGGWLDPNRFYNALHYGMGDEDNGQFDKPRQITYSPTCLLMVKREVFESVGLMDSRYFVYNDDVDFLYRCMKNNKTLWYLPQAVLHHKVSALTGGDESDFAIRFMTRNRAYFVRKHLSQWKTLLWATHFMLITAPGRVLFGKDSIRTWWLRCASVIEGWRMAGHGDSAIAR